MKKIFTTVYAILVVHVAMSQNSPCSSCFDEIQNTRIITDPSRYVEMEPSTLVGQERYKYFYQKNQFRWYEGNENTWRFKSPDRLENGIYYVYDYLSPFIAARQSSGQISHLQFLLKENFSSDNQPLDGWKLIKQDFGFWNYNNSQPDITSAEITAISPEITTQLGPRDSNFPNIMSVHTNSTKSISYMVLYNRFTATLRVIGISKNTLPNNLMYIRLEQIFSTENVNNGTPDSYMNGNFAFYQNPNQVLSQKTRTSSIGTYAKVLQGQFFFGDFQMAYDPCICLFQGQMFVTFQPITQSNAVAVRHVLHSKHVELMIIPVLRTGCAMTLSGKPVQRTYFILCSTCFA
jgi:hypothetical protein